jgi:hypothetical protein
MVCGHGADVGKQGEGVNHLFKIVALVLCGLAIGGSVAVRAQEATPRAVSGAALGYSELSIRITDAGVEMPGSVAAGRYLVSVDDATDHGIDAFLMRIPDGVTENEVEATFASPTGFPVWWLTATFAGGTAVVSGQTGQAIADLVPGDWLVFGDGHPAQPFAVTGDPAAAITAADPEVEAEITLDEYSFTGLDEIKAGPQVWKVTNGGSQPHFMELIKVPAGTTAEQIMQLLMADDEASPVAGGIDPAQIEGVGGIGTLSVGRTGWYVTDLEAGTYAALCFIPDIDGFVPHAMMGMIQVFTVD